MDVIDRWFANLSAQADQRDAIERRLDNVAAQQMSAGRAVDREISRPWSFREQAGQPRRGQ